MTVRERQQVKFLVILVAVLGIALTYVYRSREETVAARSKPAAKSASRPVNQSAQIDLELIEQTPAGENAGKNNVFQYRTGIGSPQPARPVAPPPPPVFIPVEPPPSRPSQPPPPPPPPPIPFKYEGYVTTPGGKLTAFLTDTATTTNHYNVTEGDVMVGRYRITRIEPGSIEIEDIDFNRRQTFPRIQQ